MNNLKRVIDDNGLLQRWLAKKLEIHEVDMSRYVNGATYPNKATRDRIAAYFGLGWTEVFPPRPKRKKRKCKKRKPTVKVVVPIPEGYIQI